MQATPNNEKWQDPTAPSIPPLRCESISIIQYDIHTRCWQPPTEHQTLTCTVWKPAGKKRQKWNQRVWLAPRDVHVPCLRESFACRERFHSLWTYFVTTHDEHILSLAMDSSEEFNTLLANLNGCQHFCRPSLYENVTVRPVCKEGANVSPLRYLILEWSDLPIVRMKFVLLQGDFCEIQAVNNSQSPPHSLNSCTPSFVLAISKVLDNIHGTIYSL